MTILSLFLQINCIKRDNNVYFGRSAKNENAKGEYQPRKISILYKSPEKFKGSKSRPRKNSKGSKVHPHFRAKTRTGSLPRPRQNRPRHARPRGNPIDTPGDVLKHLFELTEDRPRTGPGAADAPPIRHRPRPGRAADHRARPSSAERPGKPQDRRRPNPAQIISQDGTTPSGPACKPRSRPAAQDRKRGPH